MRLTQEQIEIDKARESLDFGKALASAEEWNQKCRKFIQKSIFLLFLLLLSIIYISAKKAWALVLQYVFIIFSSFVPVCGIGALLMCLVSLSNYFTNSCRKESRRKFLKESLISLIVGLTMIGIFPLLYKAYINAYPSQNNRDSTKQYSTVSPTGGDGSGFDAGLRDAPLTQEITGRLDRVVYLSPSGNSYHFRCSCPSLSNCEYLREMKLREAYYDYNVKDPCNICAGGS